MNELDILCLKVGWLLYSVGIYCAGVAFEDALQVLVIRVKNTVSALSEKKALAVQVFIKILVLVRADMVR